MNEEKNILPCLDSVSWCKDIVVLDSGSTDQTVVLARKKKARIVRRKFDNWSAHQNWALDHIRFKNPWVFYLDADERMTCELRDEILGIAKDSKRIECAFFVGRRNFFCGRWIKHAFPPGWLMRFFKPNLVRFERLVNPTPVIKGRRGYLKNYLNHYNFSKGLAEWIEKHNRYSTLEALEGMKVLASPLMLVDIFNPDPYSRRQVLKSLSFHLPLRALVKFFYLYFVKLGFLDGSEGFIYCGLQSFYEFMISIKTRELKLKQKGIVA